MLFYNLLLSDITGVQIQVLAFVFFIQQSFKAFGIMHFCRRGIIRKYDLIAFLNFSMLLVAVKVSSRFFVQRASTSLWHFLWGLSFHNLSPAPCFICSFSSRVLRWRGAITKLASMMRPSLNCRPLLSMKLWNSEKACHKRLYLSGVRDTSTPSSRQEHRQHIQYQETCGNSYGQLSDTLSDGHSNHNNAEETRPWTSAHSLSADDRHYFCALR